MMKKFFLIIAILLTIQMVLNAQPCLPDGITFTAQSQIDNFQINYPNCTKIQGHVWIEGETIHNLLGLSCIESIGDYLAIDGNLKLENLDGLENLDSIGGYLSIGEGYLGYGNKSLKNINGLSGLTYVGDQVWIGLNDSLTNLSGLEGIDSVYTALTITVNPLLENLSGLDNIKSLNGDLTISNCNSLAGLSYLSNLQTINGQLWIAGIMSLKSLNGIENIDPESISDLFIIDNDSLSQCEVESICSYIENPNGITNIQRNSTGCKNAEEVEEACTVSVPVIEIGGNIKVYPNPFTTSTIIEYELNQPSEVTISIYNHFGELVKVMRQKQPAGQQQVVWDAEGLPAGVYYFRLEAGESIVKGGLIKIKN